MDDYYRVRFKALLGPRRPVGTATQDQAERVEMPRTLRVVYTVTCLGAALGWIGTVAIGRHSPFALPWLGALSLLFPISVALALGFSEGESWTRPLMLVLLVITSSVLALLELLVVALVFLGLTLGALAYLYGSPDVCNYYKYLREANLLRVEMSDLRSAPLIPLYTAVIGALAGAWLGYYLVAQQLGDWSGLRANELTGAVCAGAMLAGVLGTVGRWIGEAIVSRLERA